MEAVLSEYIEDKSKNKELEIRFYLEKNAFELVYKKISEELKNNKISQFLQIIIDIDPKGDITDKEEREYKNGDKISTTSVRKYRKKFFTRQEYPKYQLSFAIEEPKDKVNVENAKIYRFKLRSTFFADEWKYDFTLTKHVSKTYFADRSYLQKIKTSIFPQHQITKDSFLQFVSQSYVVGDKLEFEIELLASDKEAKTSISNLREEVVTQIEKVKSWLEPRGTEYGFELNKALALLHSKKIITKSIKHALNQPIDISPQTYCKLLPFVDYYITDKTNGERCMILYNKKEKVVFTTTEYTKTPFVTNKIYIFDAERYSAAITIKEDKKKKTINDIYYVFDVLYNGEDVTEAKYSERYQLLTTAVTNLADPLIQVKEQTKLTDKYVEQIKSVWTGKHKYDIDGLIFTQDAPYYDSGTYKWKPPENQTIDFLVKYIVHKDIPQKAKHKTYVLCCGIQRQLFNAKKLRIPKWLQTTSDDYFLINFTPTIQPDAYIYYRAENQDSQIEDHIAEFGWDFQKSQWILKKMRPDKDALIKSGIFGNDFRTAEYIFNSYKNPFTLEKLLAIDENCSSIYFQEAKDPQFKALTRFNNFTKAQLIRQLEGAEWIIDAACGRGSDIFTYHGFNIANVIATDIDKTALQELEMRKSAIGQHGPYVYTKPGKQKINIITVQADLSTPAENIIKVIDTAVKVPRVDGIVMNFAIHYFIKNQKSIEQLFAFIDNYLKKGGLFIFTCFDGKKIFKLLEKGDFKLGKFGIKKLYDAKTHQLGQKISVIHPFSKGQYYEEYLVNIDQVVDHFCNKKYAKISHGSFGDWFQKFDQAFPKNFVEMSQDDKIYASLYSYITVAKYI
jgi:SAM-dependent methyltransferase